MAAGAAYGMCQHAGGGSGKRALRRQAQHGAAHASAPQPRTLPPLPLEGDLRVANSVSPSCSSCSLPPLSPLPRPPPLPQPLLKVAAWCTTTSGGGAPALSAMG